MRLKSLDLSLFVILVSCLLAFSDANKKTTGGNQKSVKVQLNAKWRQTPLYLEVAEFLAEENPNYFWSFLDKIGSLETDFGKITQKEQYDKSLELAGSFLRSEQKLNLLKFSLSLRSYSPTVAIFKRFAADLIEQKSILQGCDWFVEFSTVKDKDTQQFNCKLEDVKSSISSLLEQLNNNNVELQNPLIYSVDHVYPTPKVHSSEPTIVLYGDVTQKSFHSLHKYLRDECTKNGLKYIVRYIYPVKDDMPKIALSGYGVELAIKSTEYKAQDDTKVRGEQAPSKFQDPAKPDQVSGFIFSKLKQIHSSLSEKLDNFQNYLLDNDKEIATLKAWELQEISLQAVTKVLSVSKDKALSELREIAQNFPTVARSLVKIAVDPELKAEIVKNQHNFLHSLSLGTTDTAFFINGLYHDVDGTDVFTLFDIIKQEFTVVNKLHEFLDGDLERIKKFIKLDVNMEKQDYQIDIRDGSINYINDIETDKMYRNWPSSLMDMLRPTYPGALRSIRRNMFHMVLVIDPSKKDAFEILRLTESFYIHKAPVRIGLVFAVDRNMTSTGMNNAGVACLEAFNYISQQKTAYEGLSFLTDVVAYVNSQGSRDMEPEDVISSFKSKMSGHSIDEVFGPESNYDTGRQLAWEFVDRTGLGDKLPKVLMNGVLIKDNLLNGDSFEEALLMEIMKQTAPIQKAIYKSELQEDDDILDFLMSKDSVMPRLNRVILGMDKQKNGVKDRYLDFTGTPLKDATNFENVNVNDLQATVAEKLKYITYNKKETTSPVSVWFAGDFSRPQTWEMLSRGLKHLKSSSKHMRMALIFADWSPVNRVLDAAIESISCQSKLEQFISKFLEYLNENSDYSQHSAKDLLKIVSVFVSDDVRNAFEKRFESTGSEKNADRALQSAFVSRVLQMSPKDIVVTMNGKILQVPANEEFSEDDFALMEKFVMNLVGNKVLDSLLEKEKSNHKKCSDLILKLSSALFSKTNSKTRYDINKVKDEHSVLILDPKDEKAPAVEFAVILDPLSRGAQKITPIIEVFHRVFNSRVKIYFNAVDKHSDMPLKTFFRSVLSSELEFNSNGQIKEAVALFEQMPKTPLFTLGMQVPDNWMVEAVDAFYDLDNIHLESVQENEVSAIFELEHLLIEGHCFEQSSGTPPRGLQFTLGTENNPTKYDTIVMANLGYFQLKANPGIWLLRLRDGRSAEIYDIFSHEGTDKIVKSNEVVPVVSSFKSLVLKIRVNKKPDKINEELLYDADESPDSSWFSWNGGKDATKKVDKDDEDSKRINVFSLATGHLYERLMRIMMISVLRNTETPVKFWILENYLSPQFKNVLPFMAAKYKFEYELVQYKWPRWLHQQTEKQRIIWGYKILFLDVLFPLDVKKIIFVDADQVVRADLKELRDLDLEGAPYGYTPFCDSRKDMDGYRFWKQGYWATHLHNRKYHISALYVVDLQKFRRIAAGDRLRGQYQGLSQDPNSLSNLDQDLPNNMIHQVAIKSLPQEWLWCETWCDDASKKKAKTIDLCNNPKTKEPKLTGARRIIKEWETYDNELADMLKEFQTTGAEKRSETGSAESVQASKHTEL